MADHIIQVQKAKAEKLIKIQRSQEKEYKLMFGFFERAGKIADSSLKIGEALHTHTAGVDQAATSLHVVGVSFAVVALFKAINGFLQGKKVSWPHLGNLFYSSLVLGLTILTYALPAIGAILGLTVAGLGLVYSAFHLIANIYKRQKVSKKLQAEKKQLAALEDELEFDQGIAQQLANEMLLGAVGQAEIDSISIMLQENMEARDKKRVALLNQTSKTLEEYHACVIQPMRGLSVFVALLAVAAAIVTFYNPLVAGILATIAGAIGFGMVLHAIGNYIKNKRLYSTSVLSTPAESPPAVDVVADDEMIRQEKTEDECKLDKLVPLEATSEEKSDSNNINDIKEPIFVPKENAIFSSHIAQKEDKEEDDNEDESILPP